MTEGEKFENTIKNQVVDPGAEERAGNYFTLFLIAMIILGFILGQKLAYYLKNK